MSRPTAHAIILAAGRGSRLRPLTDHTPKPLIRAGGRPLIAYGLALLRRHGIEDVVINVHYLRDRIMEALGDGTALGMRIRYSVEEELLDTGGGIRQATELLGVDGADERASTPPLLVMNSDVITDLPLDRLLSAHQARQGGITLALREDPRAAEYGLFGVDDAGRVRRFLERGAEPTGLTELMFASVQVIDPRLISRMPRSGPFSTMGGVYPELFDAGVEFHGFLHSGRWYTSDDHDDLEHLESELARKPFDLPFSDP